MSTTLNKSFTCEKALSRKDVFLALHSRKQEMKATFFKCYNQQNQTLKATMTFAGNKIRISKDDASFIKRRKVNKKNDFEQLFENALKLEQNLVENFEITLELKKFKTILARLLEVHIFMKSNNFARADEVLKNLIRKESLYYSFHTELDHLGQKKTSKMIITILEKIKNKSENPRLFYNLILYLVNQSEGFFKEKILDKLDIDLELLSDLERQKSIQYGALFPFVWAPFLYENTSLKKYKDYIFNSNLFHRDQFQTSHLLFYKKNMNLAKKKLNKLKNNTADIDFNKNYYTNFIYFQAAMNKDLKPLLNFLHPKDKTPLKSKKINFYLKSIEKNEQIRFSTRQLLSLGELKGGSFLTFLAYHYEQI